VAPGHLRPRGSLLLDAGHGALPDSAGEPARRLLSDRLL